MIDQPEGAVRMERPVPAGLRRIRLLSELMDRCILLPFGWRIGLDPIVGLLPGVGDMITTACSLYLVFEAALLGLPVRTLARMMGYVVVDTVGGVAPVVGDVFDAVWKANTAIAKLADREYHPGLAPRSLTGVLTTVGIVLGLLFLALMSLVAGAWYVLYRFGSWLVGN